MKPSKPSDYIAKGWCQNVSARRDDNTACPPYDPMACKWCLIGAIRAAYPNDIEARQKVMGKIHPKIKSAFLNQIAAWNDEPIRKQSEVIALLLSIGE